MNLERVQEVQDRLSVDFRGIMRFAKELFDEQSRQSQIWNGRYCIYVESNRIPLLRQQCRSTRLTFAGKFAMQFRLLLLWRALIL